MPLPYPTQSGNGFQAGQEGQEAIKCGWKGGHHRCNEGQMGQSEGTAVTWKVAKKKDRRSSPAVRAAAAACKARWAKVKGEGKKTL